MHTSAESTWNRYVPLIVVGSVLLLGVAFALRGGFFPIGPGIPTPCGFRMLTGAPCPGCGMTRAAGLLLEGAPVAASALHPLVLPLAAAALAALGLATAEAATGRPHFRGFAERYGLRVVITFLALLFAVWLLRLLIFPDLSPDPIPPESLAGRALGG